MHRSLSLGRPLEALRQAAHPECKNDHHHAKEQRVCADDPYHGQGPRHRVSDKHHAEDNREDAADDKCPFVAYLLAQLDRGNNLEDAPDDCLHRD